MSAKDKIEAVENDLYKIARNQKKIEMDVLALGEEVRAMVRRMTDIEHEVADMGKNVATDFTHRNVSSSGSETDYEIGMDVIFG
ncbi:hypothetical protein PCE1_003175 [Barthelona sp. PCE]